MSLIGNSPVIVLDEPTAGWTRRRGSGCGRPSRTAEGGTTVLLTTQYLEEAERLADQIAILQEGRIIVNGTLAEQAAAAAGPSTSRSSRPWRRSSSPSSVPPATTATAAGATVTRSSWATAPS